MLLDPLNRAILSEPLDRGLRPTLGNAGYVVRGIPHQRQVVDNLLRRDTELVHHPLPVHAAVGHGVDQGNVTIHQLGQILVPRGDQGMHAGLGRPGGEGTDDIIRLHSRHHQQRQPHRLDDPV